MYFLHVKMCARKRKYAFRILKFRNYSQNLPSLLRKGSLERIQYVKHSLSWVFNIEANTYILCRSKICCAKCCVLLLGALLCDAP